MHSVLPILAARERYYLRRAKALARASDFPLFPDERRQSNRSDKVPSYNCGPREINIPRSSHTQRSRDQLAAGITQTRRPPVAVARIACVTTLNHSAIACTRACADGKKCARARGTERVAAGATRRETPHNSDRSDKSCSRLDGNAAYVHLRRFQPLRFASLVAI